MLDAEVRLQQLEDARRQRALRPLVEEEQRLVAQQHVEQPQVEVRLGRTAGAVPLEALAEHADVAARELDALPVLDDALAFPHALEDLDRAPHVTAALHPVPDVGRGAAVAVAGLGRGCCRHLLRALAAQLHPGVESGPNNLLDPQRLRSD